MVLPCEMLQTPSVFVMLCVCLQLGKLKLTMVERNLELGDVKAKLIVATGQVSTMPTQIQELKLSKSFRCWLNIAYLHTQPASLCSLMCNIEKWCLVFCVSVCNVNKTWTQCESCYLNHWNNKSALNQYNFSTIALIHILSSRLRSAWKKKKLAPKLCCICSAHLCTTHHMHLQGTKCAVTNHVFIHSEHANLMSLM